jgi:hypothetical protein
MTRSSICIYTALSPGIAQDEMPVWFCCVIQHLQQHEHALSAFASFHQDGARINVDTATVNPPPTTIMEQAKWAAVGHNIIIADANSDCIRKYEDKGCQVHKPGSAHFQANQLLLQGQLQASARQFAPVFSVRNQNVSVPQYVQWTYSRACRHVLRVVMCCYVHVQ